MSGYAVNITQTDQGVNMGDHGQDVIRAVAPKPDETVQQLIERTLMTFSWDDSGPGYPGGGPVPDHPHREGGGVVTARTDEPACRWCGGTLLLLKVVRVCLTCDRRPKLLFMPGGGV